MIGNSSHTVYLSNGGIREQCIPFCTQATADMHRVVGYMNELRILIFTVVATVYVSAFIYLIYRF